MRFWRVAFDEDDESGTSRQTAMDIMHTTCDIVDQCRELGFDPSLPQIQELLRTRGIDVNVGVDAQECSVIIPKQQKR